MFKRGKKEAGSSTRPALDPWAGDREAAELRSLLEAGDTAPLAAVYERSDGARRDFLVPRLIFELPALPAIESWPTKDPASPLAYLMRGTQRIAMAWATRGSGYASTVPHEAWHTFHGLLEHAEDDLFRSIDLRDDGVAWAQLLATGRGLGRPLDELSSRYERAIAHEPFRPMATDQMLQVVCNKWLGSHEHMLAFAREIVATAPVGDPRHRAIAIAHFERGIDFRGDTRGRDAYRADATAHQELVAAAERSVFLPDRGTGPQDILTLNWFAIAFGYFRQHDRARPLLEAIGASPTTSPWDYWPEPLRVYGEYRRDAGLRR